MDGKVESSSVVTHASQRGLYQWHDIYLHECIDKHIEQWTDKYTYLKSVTKTTFSMLYPKNVSVTEIVILSAMLKLRYISGDIPSDLENKLLRLQPCHYSDDLTWKDIYNHMLLYSQDATRPNSAELKNLFIQLLYRLIDIITESPAIFETHKHKIKMHDDHNIVDWKQLPSEDEKLMMLGFIEPSSFCDNAIFQLYVDIENGNFTILSNYLVQVQLHLRTLSDDIPCVNICNVHEHKGADTWYSVLRYPKSLHLDDTDDMDLRECEVTINDIIYHVILPKDIISQIKLNN